MSRWQTWWLMVFNIRSGSVKLHYVVEAGKMLLLNKAR